MQRQTTKHTRDLAAGDVVEVRRSRTTHRLPDGRVLRHRFDKFPPSVGVPVTVASVGTVEVPTAGLPVPPAARYTDVIRANERGGLREVRFTDGSVAFAPAERCGWYVVGGAS